LFEIERDAALARVEVRERKAAVGAGLVRDERLDVAKVGAARGLDQDHVGAELGEKLAAIRAHRAGKLDHPNSGECLRLRCGLLRHVRETDSN
jgi:hypothetical protein